MKIGIKETSINDIILLFNDIIDNLDLDKAPKFYVMAHLFLKLLPQEKREKIAGKVNFENMKYIPSIKNGLSQKLFCDFLGFYGSYLTSLLTPDKNLHLILDECVITNKFTRENLMKKYDVSYLNLSMDVLKQSLKVRFSCLNGFLADVNFFEIGRLFFFGT